MELYQVDYRVPGCFWMLTAYDLESCDEDDIREEIARIEGCDPSDIELFMDTLQSYRG